jgi:crossover junction endodeoxyribonuclease RuvC
VADRQPQLVQYKYQHLKEGRIILGIDPGTTVMGYGLICEHGRKPELIGLGTLELGKIKDHFIRLRRIFEYELAIEAPFYGKNIQSMLKLGRAQGVAISAALSRDLPIFEYAPRKIKMAITGVGSASKEQVAALLERMLDIKDMPAKLDATDGLAVALCHYFQKGLPASQTTYRSWNDFVAKNPGKLI